MVWFSWTCFVFSLTEQEMYQQLVYATLILGFLALEMGLKVCTE